MSFKVGVTSDILDAKGEPVFGREPLQALKVPGLEWEWLPKGIREITAEHAAAYDALYVNSPRVPAAAVAREDLRLKLVSRHGVGYDSVEVPAMSAAGVLVSNTPNAVPRPVATMALTFVLALAQKLFAKDRMTREGRWNDRVEHMGMGLTGRTLGVVGAGRIGKELLRMARVFDLKLLAADPYAEELELAYIGARKVPLEELMAASDFVVVTCLLNEETRHLVNAGQLARMKPTAYLINVARGPVVDEKALYAALASRQIAGAGLDVFEEEPTPASNPILKLENVIVSPHALCWTDELFGNIARTAIGAVLAVHAGRRPQFVVDAAALSHPRVKAWLR
ncbi:MAG TPA: NAD(P)-dependent oxidoreductase [Burkholderiales bacterium]|jgi:D-3-phosphoglycerate dehydrogenase|nr:NAD(P)-dependent oxidoreductase [Burkholderiales bacterium]